MPRPTRRFAAIAAAALLTGGAPSHAAAQAFDHGVFGRLLAAHVTDGMVDYDAFKASPEFSAYLQSLAQFDPRALPRDEQLAFWINAYNAYTIQLINQHEERKSIRNINKGLFGIKAYGPWKEKLAVVGGTPYGLDHIEQKIIRPEFKEPRIHFALVCAAMGCPPLRSEAYTGANLDEQLDQQARVFLLESPDKNRVDAAAGAVYLSQLFKFRDYDKDFGGSREAVAKFIAQYHPPGPDRELLESGQWDKWEYTEYDWNLNSQKSAGAATTSSR